jgi:DNA-directed RNA polymerase specialized sigma24 family protein
VLAAGASLVGVDVDPLLVRAVQRGEPGAMDGFIRATYADVYARAQRLLDDPSDAADATQEVYLRVVRSVLGFRGSGTGAWLERLTDEICAAALEARGAAHERGESAGDDELSVRSPTPRPTRPPCWRTTTSPPARRSRWTSCPRRPDGSC